MAVWNADVDALIARSRRLGSDPATTNYAGGNTSVKTSLRHPGAGMVDVLAVKGSGGDLGTLTASGLALLELDRVRALEAEYRGADHEDEMVGLLDTCCFGSGGAAPSIDTAMHALLPALHIDHLHPDAVIALATAIDGETLTKECYGGSVGWVPWRRPGYELALQIRALHLDNPQLKGVVLGGHGLTAWGETSDECEANSLDLITRAAAFIEAKGRPEPFGAVSEAYAALPAVERRARAAELFPYIRGVAGATDAVIGHFNDDDLVLDFLSRAQAPRLAALGTSCPDHFIRTRVRPLFVDLPAGAGLEAQVARLTELHAAYRADYRGYYEAHATSSSPKMRAPDPTVVLVPGVGMFSFGADKQTARVTGEFYVNAINAMRGAEALSTYSPIPESEKFRVEYWSLEAAKLARRPAPKPLTGKVALVTGGASGIGRAVAGRLAEAGACIAIGDINDADGDSAAADLGGADRAIATHLDVRDTVSVDACFAAATLAFGGVDIVVNNAGLSISKPLVETSIEDWDNQHTVMARGSFLVSRAAARVLSAQGRGGDIVYVVSKNAVVAGPENVAYGAAKADQAHQVRLLAAELGELGIRVNGVNPDGVVAGSGIFANGWGEQRAAVYGVPVEDLGKFYATRTLLKREVLPQHVADAVVALTTGLLPLTTGAIIPVDGGIPAAFLR
ncbi:MAG TPA: bifunctional rhamnulose-1-phosphate aldolase/short-chain dehydrogenase [Mycobacteriales bacterium]|nr:bifunctional rhamnulose-1-phosphate aldolase/short-chain dehydrogenase [Mycobacteriales bacterium]